MSSEKISKYYTYNHYLQLVTRRNNRPLSRTAWCLQFLIYTVTLATLCNGATFDTRREDNATIIITSEANPDNHDHQTVDKSFGHHVAQGGGGLWEMVASMGGSTEDMTNGGSLSTLTRNRHGNNKNLVQYDFAITLDQRNRFMLDWTYDYNNNQISFGLNLNVTNSKLPGSLNHHPGYDIFALGFSERGQLEGSDFCLIWYDLAQHLHLQDAIVNANKELELVDESSGICRLISEAGHLVSRTGQNRKSKHQPGANTKGWLEDTDGIVTLQFSRPLDACNEHMNDRQYYKIDNGTTHLVWFSIRGPLLLLDGLNIGSLQESSSIRKVASDVSINNSTSINRNDVGRFEWGMRRVQLIANKPIEHVNTRRATRHHHHDIHMETFPIPAAETTYWCKLFKLPPIFHQKRHHITKYGPLITIGNKHIVHHMELFNCANLSPLEHLELEAMYETKGGWSGECESPSRPRITKACKRVILAWAMGAKPFEYPAQVGQSIGGAHYSPYVMLEVHYNNVQQSSGLMDFSGLRFHYTSRLRDYDAGILEVGLEYTPKNSIPPGNFLVPLAGHCLGECTRLAFSENINNAIDHDRKNNNRILQNEHQDEDRDDAASQVDHELLKGGGIFVFGGQMHTHLTGIGSWTEHVRAGHLIAELQRDDHYSPHFQEIRLLPKPHYLAPGDSLIHYCLYDARMRPNITLGGFSTQEEMCVTYLHYYPRTDLEVCKSSVDSGALERYFAYLAREEAQKTSQHLEELHINDNINKQVKSVGENYNSIEWSTRRSLELMQFYSEAPLSVQCNRSDGQRFPGHWTGLQQTSLYTDQEYLSAQSSWVPFSQQPGKTGRELAGYRGQGFAARHVQCNRTNLVESPMLSLGTPKHMTHVRRSNPSINQNISKSATIQWEAR